MIDRAGDSSGIRLRGAFFVFDNNAYSAIGFKRIRQIEDIEEAIGVRPLASLVVAQELLAAVLDTESERRIRSRTALVRLWRHCQEVVGERRIVRFIADVDLQI